MPYLVWGTRAKSRSCRPGAGLLTNVVGGFRRALAGTMNLDTLSLYCDVIRSGSFSLGAASHRISQSAASQAVRQLEDEVGAQLIDRTKRPFMVTPEGKRFFEASVTLLDGFEKAKAEITQQKTSVGGEVR